MNVLILAYKQQTLAVCIFLPSTGPALTQSSVDKFNLKRGETKEKEKPSDEFFGDIFVSSSFNECYVAGSVDERPIMMAH